MSAQLLIQSILTHVKTFIAVWLSKGHWDKIVKINQNG